MTGHSDPRTSDPRTSDPRTSDPRTSDPRTSDPRTSDPRTSDPRSAYARWIDACTRAGWRGDAPWTAEPVDLAGALGRVSASPVIARWPSPRADCAAMDGIAIDGAAIDSAAIDSAASDSAASGTNAEKSNLRPERQWRLPSGAFAWIDTGDPLPSGFDTVIKREHVTIEADGGALITGTGISQGHHVRRRGEDFAAGQALVPEGRRLRPADLAVAAAGGHATLSVARAPVVAIIPTGDEIRPAGTPAGRLRPGDIIDSNSVYLSARCARAGAQAIVSDVIADDPDKLAAELARVAASADLVLVIAGSSRGRGDHTAAVLAQVGGVAVAGVAVRPGHPALLGHAKTPSDAPVPVIGLPGYPIATAVVFELFAAPLLAARQGDKSQPVSRPARLTSDWTSPEAEEWVPVSLSPGGDATPVGHGSGSTANLARSDAWWTIPPGAARFQAGTLITVTHCP